MSSIRSPEIQEVPLMHLSRLPIIDISLLRSNSYAKAEAIRAISDACQNFGFFKIINHGISESLIEGALNSNYKFFDLPIEEKEELMSNDFNEPVGFGKIHTDIMGGDGRLTRNFLKLYAHPLEEWIRLWPQNPSDYRKKMGRYTMEVRKLGIELFGAIMESLHLSPTHLRDKLEQGVHIMGVNNYQPTSQSESVIGTAPHSDHSIITILLQSSPGLHVVDPIDGKWKAVPELKGSLQVIVGDHLEILSNGMYKSILHRAIPSSEKTRFSIASFLSFELDEMVEPAMELLDEEHPKGYKGSSLREYLKHVSFKDTRTYIETLKINFKC